MPPPPPTVLYDRSLTTEYIQGVVVADQCTVFCGRKIYTRTPAKNKAIITLSFSQSSQSRK